MTDPIPLMLTALERFAREQGWEIVPSQDLAYGRQVIVTDGVTRLPVNLYHTGRIVVQGKACAMKARLTEWANLFQAGMDSAAMTGEELSPEASALPTSARVGVDEAGKGDVFGPLVVAGVLLTPATELALARRGVRDSKTLADARISQLVQLIRTACPVEVLVISPSEYNRAYEQQGRNLNRLLAWGHAQVIARLSRGRSVARAVCDQFGDAALLIDALAAAGCRIALEQRPHAESDLAVAAASVVARAEFVAAIREYGQEIGLRLPLGAAAGQVENAAKQIYQRWGRQGLERVAKMHFASIQKVLAVDRRG